MKKFFYIFFLLGASVLVGCNFPGDHVEDPVKPTQISIDDVEELTIGDTYELIIAILPNEASRDLIFSTSDPDIAVVTNDGVVFALNEGEVTITAISAVDNSIYDTIQVRVVKLQAPVIVPVLEASFVERIKIFKISRVNVEVEYNGDYELVFESLNQDIAYIDNNGNVYPIDIGNVDFKVSIKEFPEVFVIISTEVVDDLKVEYDLTEVMVGKTIYIKGTLIPDNSGKTISFLSSDPNIATVDSDGFVTGVNVGNAIITVFIDEDPDTFHTVNIEVIEVLKYDYVASKVLSIDTSISQIELLNCEVTKYTSRTKIIRYVNGNYQNASINDLYIGMDNVYVRFHKERQEIDTILIDGPFGLSNIRVAIRKSLIDTSINALYHDDVELSFNQYTLIQTFDGVYSTIIPKDNVIKVNIVNGSMVVSMDNQELISTDKRIFIQPEQDGTTRFNSITRSLGVPVYEGSIELSLANGRILAVNDINIESYLTKVVPSEMPASFHIEALKAQAIAARTYAFRDLLNRSRQGLGYSVDDSVNSQVYNNQFSHPTTTNAVIATAGLVMTYNNSLINAYYYSTSSGLTANVSEIWGNHIPYLVGANFAKDEFGNTIQINPQNEASMLDFFKTIKMDTPDVGSKYHRWKISFTYEEFAKMINTTLPNMNPNNNLLTLVGGSWVSRTLPADLGVVTRVYVSERAVSGIVMSIVVETTTGNYMIKNQSSIRFWLRPSNARIDNSITTYYANNTDVDYNRPPGSNETSLNSAFFAIEENGNGITLYGGGYGHGTGMSQYGAQGFGLSGYSYDDILKKYYLGITIDNRFYEYVQINNYRELIDNYYD